MTCGAALIYHKSTRARALSTHWHTGSSTRGCSLRQRPLSTFLMPWTFLRMSGIRSGYDASKSVTPVQAPPQPPSAAVCTGLSFAPGPGRVCCWARGMLLLRAQPCCTGETCVRVGVARFRGRRPAGATVVVQVGLSGPGWPVDSMDAAALGWCVNRPQRGLAFR